MHTLAMSLWPAEMGDFPFDVYTVGSAKTQTVGIYPLFSPWLDVYISPLE
jgi:hypothetical protein